MRGKVAVSILARALGRLVGFGGWLELVLRRRQPSDRASPPRHEHTSAGLRPANVLGEPSVELVHADDVFQPVEPVPIGKLQGDQLGLRWMELAGLEPATSCMPCRRYFQLSYSPELVIGPEVYCGLLGILRWGEAQINLVLPGNHLNRNEITAVKLQAVGRQSVDLVREVCRTDIASAAGATTTYMN